MFVDADNLRENVWIDAVRQSQTFFKKKKNQLNFAIWNVFMDAWERDGGGGLMCACPCVKLHGVSAQREEGVQFGFTFTGFLRKRQIPASCQDE